MSSKHKLDIDHSRDRLASFGLAYAAEQFEPLLSEAVKSDTPPHAFLDTLLEAEYQGARPGASKRRCVSRTCPRG